MYCPEQSQERCGREKGMGLVSPALGDGAQRVGRQSGCDGWLEGQCQDLSDAAC